MRGVDDLAWLDQHRRHRDRQRMRNPRTKGAIGLAIGVVIALAALTLVVTFLSWHS
jgi:hypothetical protein